MYDIGLNGEALFTKLGFLGTSCAWHILKAQVKRVTQSFKELSDKISKLAA